MTDRDPLNPRHKLRIVYKDGTEAVKAYASAAERMEAMQHFIGVVREVECL